MKQKSEARHKILLLDDDPDLLQLYQEILAQMPSRPDVRTANSGTKAMAMLESEPFRLLICDLKMPKMDGLQVLSIVRRKHPQLRTVAMTSVVDEQFRSRAYALGVDLFWHKPGTEQEIQLFLECLESLLGREVENGFRGLQSKSLVDIVQLECISQSSSVLRITNGPSTGKVWIQDGEVIDAEAGDLGGEEAFKKILSWKAGHFETFPADPRRNRTIFKSYNGLLLESAQALDEQLSNQAAGGAGEIPALDLVAQVDGVEFVLALDPARTDQPAARGLENPRSMAEWARQTMDGFRALGEKLEVGPIEQLQGLGLQRHVALASRAEQVICVGWKFTMHSAEIKDGMRKVQALWES
jgi:CheY-like chemotaxis protein